MAVAFCTSVVTYANPTGASACTGGIAFDWAVAHQHGGIIQAVVESKYRLQDFTDDIVVTDAKVVRGDPALPFRISAAAGLPCEQVADAGETILILYDIRGGKPPITIATYYVVSGPDALSATVLRDGLGSTAPPTDTDPVRTSLQTSPFDWLSFAVLASAFAIGVALLTRRTSQGRPTS
jgi:hypothetical protein